jgi:hypothetical protein
VGHKDIWRSSGIKFHAFFISGHLHAPSDLPRGKEIPALTEEEAGWAPDKKAVAKRKILASTENRHPVSSVVSHFNDSATPSHYYYYYYYYSISININHFYCFPRTALFYIGTVLAYFPYFEKIKGCLWYHLAVCVSVCVCPSVCVSPLILRLMRPPCCLFVYPPNFY